MGHFRKVVLVLISIFIIAGCSTSAAEVKQPAPHVELSGLDKTLLNTADIDKPMLLNFWASWCQYCNAEIPILDTLYDEYKDRVEFVSVNIFYNDNLSGAKKFIDKHELGMPMYLDIDGIASDSFRVHAVPTFVAVDANGDIIAHRIGALGDNAEQWYREQLDALSAAAQ